MYVHGYFFSALMWTTLHAPKESPREHSWEAPPLCQDLLQKFPFLIGGSTAMGNESLLKLWKQKLLRREEGTVTVHLETRGGRTLSEGEKKEFEWGVSTPAGPSHLFSCPLSQIYASRSVIACTGLPRYCWLWMALERFSSSRSAAILTSSCLAR